MGPEYWKRLIEIDPLAIHFLSVKSFVGWPYVRIMNNLIRFNNIDYSRKFRECELPVSKETVFLKLNDAALELLKDPAYDLKEE